VDRGTGMTKAIRTLLELERSYTQHHNVFTDVAEVWFAGCHSGGIFLVYAS